MKSALHPRTVTLSLAVLLTLAMATPVALAVDESCEVPDDLTVSNGGNLYVTEGKIGIGTTDPQQALHLFSLEDTKIWVQNASPTTATRTLLKLMNNGKLRFSLVDTSTGVNWNFQNDGTGDFVISKAGTEFQELVLSGEGQLSLTGGLLADGNVGIGTPAPTTPLHVQVNDAGYPMLMTVQNVGSNFAGFRFETIDGAIDFNNAAGNVFRLNMVDGDPWELQLDQSGVLYLAGGLGIGVSSPAYNLHVVENSVSDVALFETDGPETKVILRNVNGSETTWGLSLSGPHDEFRISKQGTGGPELALSSAGDLTVTGGLIAAGNVGIGTEAPASPLHIRRTDGSAQLSVEEASTVAAARTLLHLKNPGAVRFDFEDTRYGFWRFQVQNAADEFVISRSDTGASEMKLDSSGNLTIPGALTTGTSTYPDYVFGHDYDLMPMEELARYIEQEKHLPNIPTADEVEEAGGINISELQIKLLEKVEELTLYTLAQEETIQGQREALTSQQAIIEDLHQRLAALEASIE